MKQILFYDPATGRGISTAKGQAAYLPAASTPENPHIETSEVIDNPADWIVANGVVSRAVVVTKQMVDAERDRRIAAGFVFDGKMIDFDAVSKENITGAGAMAGTALAMGAVAGDLYWHGGPEPFSWITADNTKLELDAASMFSMSKTAGNHVTAHFMAGRALKDLPVITSTYADDEYWP
ncbi:DUF4376 domain-containing protein [Tritonibacter mobilis]|uniref:DUF4376 domain-containing protein n=1 Tax=Tritonibacter mobilis F1926 TaxID=1265309 RepID=A0A1B1A6K1_9RHOB|nr:DUF4376 domain-containing protein [Tritonibacter mobilis]ANP42191.1 hypothetical protein K529_015535 [Tritonibacter mobilis F1926]KJZ22293.1 hypothetical protein TW79_18875 [Tritonibacter mobilis]